MKSYIEIIRGLREDNDLSQTAIAKIINKTQQQYSRYEKGTRELPLSALMTLADFYGLSTDYLLGRTNRKEGAVNTGEKITDELSAGEVISDIAMLSPERRATAIEFILFLKGRELADEGKKKDGNNKKR